MTVFMESFSKHTNLGSCGFREDIYTPGANLTYLAPPPPQDNFFMGAKSFIGTPEMQRIFVLKDKLNCTMEKMHGFHGNH